MAEAADAPLEITQSIIDYAESVKPGFGRRFCEEMIAAGRYRLVDQIGKCEKNGIENKT